MPLFSRRLLHVLTLSDLAAILTPTYAEAMSVEDEEAHERLTRALSRTRVADDLYDGISEALEGIQGARTSEDALLDKLSKGVQKRRSRVKVQATTPDCADPTCTRSRGPPAIVTRAGVRTAGAAAGAA